VTHSTRSRAWLGRSLRALALTGVALAGRAGATTSDGAIVTNVASATFNAQYPGAFVVSYASTATVLVANPCITLRKDVSPSVQAAVGTLTFRLWVVNCSPYASAFNVSIIDKLPDNVGFNTDIVATGSWSPSGLGVWSQYESLNGTAWAAGAPPVGQVTPYYLRFILSLLGPGKSAYVQYGVNIL